MNFKKLTIIIALWLMNLSNSERFYLWKFERSEMNAVSLVLENHTMATNVWYATKPVVVKPGRKYCAETHIPDSTGKLNLVTSAHFCPEGTNNSSMKVELYTKDYVNVSCFSMTEGKVYSAFSANIGELNPLVCNASGKEPSIKVSVQESVGWFYFTNTFAYVPMEATPTNTRYYLWDFKHSENNTVSLVLEDHTMSSNVSYASKPVVVEPGSRYCARTSILNETGTVDPVTSSHFCPPGIYTSTMEIELYTENDITVWCHSMTEGKVYKAILARVGKLRKLSCTASGKAPSIRVSVQGSVGWFHFTNTFVYVAPKTATPSTTTPKTSKPIKPTPSPTEPTTSKSSTTTPKTTTPGITAPNTTSPNTNESTTDFSPSLSHGYFISTVLISIALTIW